ncbi:MAG: energy-coupling factor transporter transmembrane protein EcfT [Bifidobacteriaceae bacterium]|jgi:energy-coupling factor transport system permease protein|nr:energy-coupling factor transporter transmembrane protein EcfT [Bifidobacteriaceae bacterium]
MARSRDSFSVAHPAVNFAFYAAVLGISMFCLHPFVLGISLVSAILYGAFVRGWRHMARLLGVFIVPGIIVVAILNPTFNHNGVTLLFTLSNGNSITLEAIVYGVALAITLAVATAWFVSLNVVLTRDKFVYAVGRVFPTASLILSMSFRFIPLFLRQFHDTTVSQRYLGHDMRSARWWEKIRIALTVTSSLFTWSMENAIHVSDSMRARGYGRRHRSSYSPHRWDTRNVLLLVVIASLAGITIVATANGGLAAQYDPTIVISGIHAAPSGVWTWLGAVAFLLLANVPVAVRLFDVYLWKRYERALRLGPGTRRQTRWSVVLGSDDVSAEKQKEKVPQWR